MDHINCAEFDAEDQRWVRIAARSANALPKSGLSLTRSASATARPEASAAGRRGGCARRQAVARASVDCAMSRSAAHRLGRSRREDVDDSSGPWYHDGGLPAGSARSTPSPESAASDVFEADFVVSNAAKVGELKVSEEVAQNTQDGGQRRRYRPSGDDYGPRRAPGVQSLPTSPSRCTGITALAATPGSRSPASSSPGPNAKTILRRSHSREQEVLRRSALACASEAALQHFSYIDRKAPQRAARRRASSCAATLWERFEPASVSNSRELKAEVDRKPHLIPPSEQPRSTSTGIENINRPLDIVNTDSRRNR